MQPQRGEGVKARGLQSHVVVGVVWSGACMCAVARGERRRILLNVVEKWSEVPGRNDLEV